MEQSLMLGIDAGSARMVAILAELAEGGPRVIGLGVTPSAGIRRGMVTDLNAAAASMRKAATQACEMAGRPGVTRAVVGVSGSHFRSLVGSANVAVHKPSTGVSPEDIRKVLEMASTVELPEGREVVHVVPRSYRLDESENLSDPLGLAGRSLFAEAHLITGDVLLVQNYLRAAVLAGLEVADYQVGLRAAGEALLSRTDREKGVLLLNMGAGTTGVAVYDRGFLYHLAILPVGGEHITSDIAALLQVPVGLAEELKVQQGWAAADLCDDTLMELPSPSGQKVRTVPLKQMAQIIESRVQEILQLAAQEVKRSGYTGLFPAGLVLTGDGCRLRGLPEMAADCLGLPARVAGPEGALAHGPEFSTAVGLVQWGAHLLEDEAAAAVEAVRQNRWSRVAQWLRDLLR